MNISHELTNDLVATIKIEVEKTDFIENVDIKLKEYAKNAKMSGFREGKVPKGLINKMYGKSIMVEELNKFVSDSLSNYIKENNIKTFLNALPNKDKQKTFDLINEDKFDFYFDIALRPEIVIDFDKIENIKKYKIKTTEEEVNEAVKYERLRQGTSEQIDVISEEDDGMVICKFTELDENGEPLIDGINKDVFFLTSKISDIQTKKELIGKPAKSRIILNPLKAFGNKNYIASILRIDPDDIGDTMNDFEVVLESFGKTIPVELNKDLFIQVFPHKEIETEDQFRDAMFERLNVEKERQSNRKMIDDVFDFIIESNDLELPKDFIKRFLIESNELDKTSQEKTDSLIDGYLENLKYMLVKDEIVNENDLNIKEDDYFRFFDMIINKRDEERQLSIEDKDNLLEIMSHYLKDEKEREQIENSIFEIKLSELFNNNISFEEVSISIEEFYKKFYDTDI